MLLWRKSVLGALAALCGVASGVAAFEIPIQVSELVPVGTAGRARQNEVVSLGIPLGDAEAITSLSEFGLAGAEAAQFRVLRRDATTGRIRWVEATFPASTPGRSYALVRGTGGFGGANLATDDGSRIIVQTGAARFEVRKSGFNLLDRVVRGSAEIVASHADGGIVVLSGGTLFTSSADPGSEVVLESNGPVRAVVRAQGTLRNSSGAALLDFTARLQFDRNGSGCRAFVTLRNADLASPSVARFDAAWVELPLRLQGSRQVTFGFPGSGFSGTLEPAGTAHLFQGDNTFQRGARTGNILPNLTPAQGLEVVVNGATYNSLGSTSDVSRGWMRLQDGTHAVLAGMRDLATLFPSGFDVQGDRLAVELFSRCNSFRDLVFSWGTHETREILFEFAAAGVDPEPFRYRLQHPLAGRCSFEHYRDTGAIWGEKRLVTVAEERAVFAELGKSWNPKSYAQTDIKLDRDYSFGTTGGGNQFDQDECHLLDWLRTGDAGRFLQGRLGVQWKADQAVPHSDDFDYGTRQNGISDVRVDQPAGFHGKGSGSWFDDEHPHWLCMPLYYLLTGDERVREASLEYGEWRRYRAGNPTYGAVWGGALNHFRLWSRAYRDIAILAEFSGEPRYLEDLRRMTSALVNTLEVGTGNGRNLERGYWYFGDETDATRRIHLFFLTEMNAIGVHEALRVLPADDPLREDLRDYFHGLAWFTLKEAQISPQAIGYPYGYYAAAPNPDLGTRGDQTGLVLAHGYKMSGDPEFAQRARSFAWRVVEYQHELRASELSTHVRLHTWLHRAESGAVYVDPQVTRNGNGSYTLRWATPPGARESIVKYGSKPLVENLGFDASTRQFHFDPATSMNFWAAKNVSGEPAPGAVGSANVFSTPPLGAGPWYFKVKVLTNRAESPVAPSQLRLGGPGTPSGPRGSSVPGSPKAGEGAAGELRVRFAKKPPSHFAFTGLPVGSTLGVYDVGGRLVRRWSDVREPEIVWDGRGRSGMRVASGVFLYRVDAGSNRTQRGRIVLVP